MKNRHHRKSSPASDCFDSSTATIYLKYHVSLSIRWIYAASYMSIMASSAAASPWRCRVMSKRATAQSAASSLAHIYKPDPVAARCVKPARAGRTSSVAGAERKGWTRRRVWKSYRPGPKAASGNEQQIAMGTRSFLLLPRWTNSEASGGIQSMAAHMWFHTGPPSHSPLFIF